MKAPIVWRFEPYALIICIGIIVVIVGTYVFFPSKHKVETVKTPEIVIKPSDILKAAVEGLPTATDYSKCIDPNYVYDNKNLAVEITLRNKCEVRLQDFWGNWKVYDDKDARIGWINESFSALDPGEKVKVRKPYPIEDYPLTKNGVNRIAVDEWKGESK